MPLQSLCLTIKSLRICHISSPTCGCEEKNGCAKGTKTAPWCKHCSCYNWWKGTSQDEVMLISEEINSIIHSLSYACMKAMVSKQVSHVPSMMTSIDCKITNSRGRGSFKSLGAQRLVNNWSDYLQYSLSGMWSTLFMGLGHPLRKICKIGALRINLVLILCKLFNYCLIYYMTD